MAEAFNKDLKLDDVPVGLAATEAGQAAKAAAPQAPKELPERTWVDNTGRYSVQGRLLLIRDNAVQIMKSNGRTTTVPFDRLSSNDRKYVSVQIAKYGRGIVGRFASR